ncbi:MAG TPA: LysE family translocator [Hyphomicrobiaceae bacterium]|jgi:threonine/homoserine/homoserine lactone efflux protein|nr:LysE family translocator [Hyphomicrobiaceae bacterium]
MDPAALLIFAATLFVAAASPGPGIAAIVARVLGRGLNGAVAFTVGLAIGDVVWLTVAVLGLAAIANTFHVVFLIIKYAGVVYLLYLAYRLWTQAVEAREVVAQPSTDKSVRLFLAGLAVTMGNPKVMVFYLALLPSLIDLQVVTLLGWLELSLVTLSVLAVVFGSYVLLAARTRALFTSPRAIRMVNRGTGAMMASAAVAMAAK